MNEKTVQAREKQVKLAQSFNDGIEYKILKRKNNVEALTTIKADREKQNENHLEFLKIKNEYDIADSKEYPSWIFCEPSVLDFYKFTIADLKTNILPLDKIEDRKNLLDSTADKGQLFFDVRDRLLSKSELNKYLQAKEDVLEFLYRLFKDLFTEHNYNTFKYCKSMLDEGKKNKKKLYVIKNNIQVLEDETGINISKFFSVNWNLPELYIPIKKSQQKKNKGIDFEFDLRIDKISEFSNKIIQEDKYIYQTLNRIQQKTISILTGNSDETLIYKQNSDDDLKKKWSELSDEQRLDRIKDYCNHYIINKIYLKTIDGELERFKDEKKITTSFVFENESTLIDKLYKLLLDNFKSENLKYRQIKWSTKNGIIETITNFSLTVELKDECNIILTPMFKETDKSLKKKKISSSKSLIGLKSNIENINEILVKFILNTITNYNGDDYDKLKDDNIEPCLERIKFKLKLNKITNVDKDFIVKNYNTFFKEILEEIN